MHQFCLYQGRRNCAVELRVKDPMSEFRKLFVYPARVRMVWTTILQRIREWRQKNKLRRMLRRVSSIRHLEKGISADRSKTERLLLSLGARKSDDEWTLNRN